MQKMMILSFSFILFIWNYLSAEEYEISDEKSWVNPIQYDTDISLPDNLQGGEYYHLFEQQTFLEKSQVSYYKRSIIELVNIRGVEDYSQISIDFDPSYEKLFIHDIYIKRDGRVINKLENSDINVFHRETDMDALIYDGSKTFNVILKDVRVGDILEYSYTIEGINPVFNNKFSKSYYLDWSIPVNRLYIRILNNKGTPLFFNYLNDQIKPSVTGDENTSTEYIWETSSNNSFRWESSTPDWYNPLNIVEISEYDSWFEFKQWARELFNNEYNDAEILSTYNAIIDEDSSIDEKLFTIINWVQEEIRYLGLESGIDSHRPTSPDITLKRRFGDCKDKSYLLVVLLKTAGIKSWPVLVNTNTGKTLNKSIPMTGLFNHAIIAVEMDNQIFWVDPTATYQEGKIRDFYQPDYYNALILDESDEIFISMDKGPVDIPNIDFEYKYNLSKTIPTFEVKTINKYDEADYQRYYYDTENMKTIEEKYINYYTREYQGIEKNKDVIFEDDKINNTFITSESYIIPDIWEIDDDTKKKSVSLYPLDISGYINKPKDLRRKMPLQLNYPLKITHKIIAEFDSEQGAFSEDNFNLTSEYIEFDFKSSFKNQTLINTYSFRTLKDSIPSKDVKTYLKDIDTILEKFNYSYYNQFDKEASSDINIGRLIYLIIIILTFIYSWIRKSNKKRKLSLAKELMQ